MLPRISTKVHPFGPPSTSTEVSDDKGEAYNCIQSPSSLRPHDAKSKSSRLLYNYPRLSFMMLFIVCTYIGGIYVSTEITAWTLDMLGARNDLTDARKVYAAASHMLNTMTQCVDQSSLEYLAGAKLQFEADSRRVQEIINANDPVLAVQRNATMTCEYLSGTCYLLACFLILLTRSFVRLQCFLADIERTSKSCHNRRYTVDARLLL